MGIFDAGSIMSHLRLEDSSFSSGILKAQGLTSLLGNSISTFLANPLLGVANMAKQALGGIKDLVMGTAKAADEFAKMAKATGVGIEFLSGMRHAAELSGTSMDSVRQSLVFLARGAADTAEGTGAAAGAFQELGITVTNADGSLKGAQQLFLESAEALSQVDDETKRTALTMDIFGRGAGSMIPLLLEGKEGIEGMVAEAKALGLTFDEAGGKAAERFNDAMTRIKATFAGLAQSTIVPLFESLAPVLEACLPVIKLVADALGAVLRVIAKIIEYSPIGLIGKMLGSAPAGGSQPAEGSAGAEAVAREVGGAMRESSHQAYRGAVNRIREERDRTGMELAVAFS